MRCNPLADRFWGSVGKRWVDHQPADLDGKTAVAISNATAIMIALLSYRTDPY
jgi:hypothetical protein